MGTKTGYKLFSLTMVEKLDCIHESGQYGALTALLHIYPHLAYRYISLKKLCNVLQTKLVILRTLWASLVIGPVCRYIKRAQAPQPLMCPWWMTVFHLFGLCDKQEENFLQSCKLSWCLDLSHPSAVRAMSLCVTPCHAFQGSPLNADRICKRQLNNGYSAIKSSFFILHFF